MSALTVTATAEAGDSLYEDALREAERHKWIESQKHGRDLGETAIREWFRVYWVLYCRSKRLEHVQGKRRWREFEQTAFGQLYSLIVAGDLLLDRILDRLDAGYENLDILLWALEWGLPIERIVSILEQIDVNRARIEPHGI